MSEDYLKKRLRKVKIVQYENNPKTGESLNFNASNIERGIEKYSHRLRKWAWVKHDKDVVTEADIKDAEVEGDYTYTAEDLGKAKGVHYHVVLELVHPSSIGAIAKTFGVPPQFVQAIKGSNAKYNGVLECIWYMTHEDEKQKAYGKHVYDRSEVHLSHEAIWSLVDEQNMKTKIERDDFRAEAKVMLDMVLNGMTLRQAYQRDSIVYAENLPLLKRARTEYLKNAPVPLIRTNYYISGEGGAGKSTAAKVFARMLRPDIVDDEELFFVVGDRKVPFDGYDGQPIIIWDDWRAEDILAEYDRGLVWKLFAINPERIDVNIKFGNVRLINTINIVTSVQPYRDFTEGLAGEYKDSRGVWHKAEDNKQAYRRFPFFIEIGKETVLMAQIKGLHDDEYKQIERVLAFENNFIALATHQARGNRQGVLEHMAKPVEVMTKGANKFQGLHEEIDALPELGEFKEIKEYHNE